EVLPVDAELAIALPGESENRVRADSDGAVDGGAQVHAEKGQIGIRDGVDEMADDVLAGGGKLVVLAAERHDRSIGADAGEAGQTVCLQSGADHKPTRRPVLFAGADGDR